MYKLDQAEKGEKVTTPLKFRKNLIRQLVGEVRNKNSRKRGRPSSSSDVEERLNGRPHFIIQNEKNPQKTELYAAIGK